MLVTQSVTKWTECVVSNCVHTIWIEIKEILGHIQPSVIFFS